MKSVLFVVEGLQFWVVGGRVVCVCVCAEVEWKEEREQRFYEDRRGDSCKDSESAVVQQTSWGVAVATRNLLLFHSFCLIVKGDSVRMLGTNVYHPKAEGLPLHFLSDLSFEDVGIRATQGSFDSKVFSKYRVALSKQVGVHGKRQGYELNLLLQAQSLAHAQQSFVPSPLWHRNPWDTGSSCP
jgi:hypothetical protein